MLELIIQKKKKTKVVVDGDEFLPTRSLDDTDYYLLPCDDGRIHNLEVVHYAGGSDNGVLAVIGDRPTPARSVLREMGSASTNLYFCRLKLKIAAKMDSVIRCLVSRICNIDKWGQTSYCNITVDECSRARILEQKREYYPNPDIRKRIVAIESGMTIVSAVLYTAIVLVVASLIASSIVNFFVGAMVLVFLVPLGLIGLLVLAWRMVSIHKHSGPPNSKK